MKWSHSTLRDSFMLKPTESKVILSAVAVCRSVLVATCVVLAGAWFVPDAYACDIGGCFNAGSGGGTPAAPPEPDPCKDECECGGAGGGGDGPSGGDNGAGSPPGGSGDGYGSNGYGVGDPVSPTTGKEFLTHTDLVVEGAYPIRMLRKFDSQTRYDSPLGYGWAFSYDKRLFKYADGSVIVRKNCGVRNRYVFSGNAYQTPVGTRATLTENPDGTFVVTQAGGSQEFYDAQGKLSAVQDPQGNRLEMSYDTRGRLPLVGSSPFALDPATPAIVAYDYRLTKVEERLASGTLTGNYVDIHYDDATGRVTDIQSSDGRQVTYNHDTTQSAKHGNLLQVNGLEGLVSTFVYNDVDANSVLQDAHNLTSIQIGANTTPYINQYDAQDRVIRQTHGANVYAFAYTPGVETTVTHSIYGSDGTTLLNTLATTYVLDENGYPEETRWTLTDGTVYRQMQTRNAEARVTQEDVYATPVGGTEALVRSITYDYDTAGNKTLEEVTLADGEIITKIWGHDHNWVAWEQAVSSADPAKVFRTEYTFYYDASGNPTNIHEVKRRKDDGSFQTTTYTYTAQGEPQIVTHPDGTSLRYTYNTAGRVTQVARHNVAGTELAFLKTSYDYDAQGNRNWMQDADGNITTLGYDDRGRVTLITNALGEETHYTYTGDYLTQVEVGRTAADGEGQVTRLNYTPQGWLESVQRKQDDGGWLTDVTYTYDSRGKVLTSTDAQARITRYTYDALGRLTNVTDPKTKTTTYAYDALGNRTQVTDARNNVTRFTYDALSRLVKTEQLGITPAAVTTMAYDAADNLVRVTDAENKTTTYTYDALSNNTAVRQPLGQTVNHVYDSLDRLDYTLNARGQKIDYTYRPWGGIGSVGYYPNATSTTADRTIGYTYTYTGRLYTAYDDHTGYYKVWDYDVLNRVDTEYQYNLGTQSLYLDHDYDRYGNRNAVSLYKYTGSAWAQQSRYTYAYTKLNRITSATLISPTAYTFDYYPSGELENLHHPSGLTTHYAYEPNGPVQSIAVSGSAGTLVQDGYTYDDTLNVDTITTLAGLHDYGYDGLNRLTQALHPAATGLPSQEDFGYDKVGNREDTTDPAAFGYDTNNRITQSPNRTYAFDDDGNMLSRGDGGTFTYDHDNRLIQYQNGTTTATYAYDPFGQRLNKTVATGSGTTTTWYLWDGDVLLAEYDGAGNEQKRYAYLPDSYVPGQMQDANGTYDVHSDHLQTPKTLTNQSQTVVWKASYTAYGETVIDTNPDGDANSITLNQRYPGQYFDAETGLYYNFYRYYDPSTGRYVTGDPIGLAGGINLYAYAGSNPLFWSDPTGEGWVLVRVVLGACGKVIQKVWKWVDDVIKKPKPPEPKKPQPTPNWKEPTNPPQKPPAPDALPDGHTVRKMPPTDQYPNGYWRQYDRHGNPVDPSTGKTPGNVSKAESRARTHVPLPPE